ncbi:hypothetical protein Vadar_033011 [Vaccinium darrowii]|uniref:Uncharacterized protein n=1 Tax=Vaccinium darrowii TaxID=229202 RepID=A0ACB7ZQI8_9ERIC|nr:hypothetical protein Vadar_033011 [Vaccinium darrowii]
MAQQIRRAKQSLNVAAGTGDINGLYRSIEVDPHVLDRIDAKPFVDTPLHTAVSAGHTDFAIEILRLMPSFGRKLNPDGLSSLHLALINEKFETAKRLIEFDKELIRVYGREGTTPLHVLANYDIYGDQPIMVGHIEQQRVTDEQQRVADIEQQRVAAEQQKVADRVNILAEFLFACPNSIEDLTIRDETALHIAVKSKNQKAVEVILGCICRIDRKRVLDYKDREGNTALCMAVSTAQDMIVSSLHSAGASSGRLTQILSSLRSLGALESSSPDPSLAEFLSSPEEPLEVLFKIKFRLDKAESMQLLNIGLVVAMLIATVLSKLKSRLDRVLMERHNVGLLARNMGLVRNMARVTTVLVAFIFVLQYLYDTLYWVFDYESEDSEGIDLEMNESYVNFSVWSPLRLFLTNTSKINISVPSDSPVLEFKYAKVVLFLVWLLSDLLDACFFLLNTFIWAWMILVVLIMLILPGSLYLKAGLFFLVMGLDIPPWYTRIFMVASSCCGLMVFFGRFAPFIIEAHYRGFTENSLFSNLQRKRLLMLERLTTNALGQ